MGSYNGTPPAINSFATALAGWMGKQGYGIPAPRRVRYVEDFAGQQTMLPGQTSFAPASTDEVGALSGPEGIDVSPAWQTQLTQLAHSYEQQRRPGSSELGGLRILLHELMHQGRVEGENTMVGYGPDDRLWEEGIAQQSADDLMAAATKQLFGYTMRPPRKALRGGGNKDLMARVADPARRDRQIAFRQLSTFGSGAKSYRDHDARVWRRRMAMAPLEERHQMIEQANAARAAWPGPAA